MITGVAGFIGSHTCEKLLQEGYRVLGIDNLNDYYNPQLKKNNLKILRKFPNFHFFQEDIREFDNLSLLFQKHSISTVIHLAAQAGIRYSAINPFVYQHVNVGGTLNLLELAHQFGCTNFLFASSSSVYGNQKKIPFSEEDPTIHPISVYAATKQAGEALCYTYHHLYNLNINCLRLFTVYGPRGRPDMSPHIFTEKLLKKEKIQIFDTPEGITKRDFSFISDIVGGIVKVIDFQRGFQIFNIGYGLPIKLMDFLAILEELTGIKAEVEYVERQPGDVDITHADISKTKKILGYKPEVAINEGLEMFVRWFKEYYGYY